MARVSDLEITGYRSIRDGIEISFPTNAPIVLVGENNAGKSNIVRALNLMLGQYSPGYHDPEDHEYFGRDPASKIKISIHFEDGEELGNNWSAIHWTCDNGDVTFTGICPHNPRLKFISNDDRDSCACMLIEADRNLRYQLGYSSKYTLMSRMMRRLHKLLSEDQDIKAELEALFENTKTAFHKLQQFQEFVDSLKQELENLIGSMTHKLEVDFQAYNPANFFQALQMHALEDGQIRTLEEMGTGEQQVLAMAFAHAYAKSFHTGVLLVIEEPEAHLHPLAQKWLARRIGEMCADGLQVVLTTHNASFIDIKNIEGLVLVTKDADGTKVKQLDRQDLVAHCVATGVPEDKVDEDNILPFYAANTSREILEGFFAKKVVLVEGPSECLSLPIYLAKVGLDVSKRGIAIVPVGGKGNLAKWRRLFTAYGIPTFVIFDNDGKADDKQKIKRRDALTAVGLTDEEPQDEFLEYDDIAISDQFAVFGTNFEEAFRKNFPGYKDLEDQGREAGVDSKPFLARYVAENLAVDDAQGWNEIRALKKALRELEA
jgi:putative ATP-dependent endonuclease of OLD family